MDKQTEDVLHLENVYHKRLTVRSIDKDSAPGLQDLRLTQDKLELAEVARADISSSRLCKCHGGIIIHSVSCLIICVPGELSWNITFTRLHQSVHMFPTGYQ